MLSADGCVVTDRPADTGCCPPPLCGNDLCCTFVNFFQLLPSGPIWDYWKAAAISYFNNPDNDPAQCPLITNPRCPSIVLHSIYTVLKLRAYVHGPLWVAYRESNVYTAVTTLDAHLERLQWEDCYRQACRSPSLGLLSPLEVMGECGPIFCPPNYPPELELAMKRAIAIALTRAQMSPIKNLCGINWIIEPLGARLTSVYPPEPCIDPPDEFDNPEGCEPYEEPPCELCDPDDWCKDMAYSLCYFQDWIEGVGSGDVCEMHLPRPQVLAYWDWGCDKPAGLPERVWPGVLAAECIIRSLMPYRCPAIPITRCC